MSITLLSTELLRDRVLRHLPVASELYQTSFFAFALSSQAHCNISRMVISRCVWTVTKTVTGTTSFSGGQFGGPSPPKVAASTSIVGLFQTRNQAVSASEGARDFFVSAVLAVHASAPIFPPSQTGPAIREPLLQPERASEAMWSYDRDGLQLLSKSPGQRSTAIAAHAVVSAALEDESIVQAGFQWDSFTSPSKMTLQAGSSKQKWAGEMVYQSLLGEFRVTCQRIGDHQTYMLSEVEYCMLEEEMGDDY